MTTLDLRDGDLILLSTDDEGETTSVNLGPVEDAAHAVPADLFDDFVALLDDHRDAVAFGRACRGEAAWCYATTRGV